MGDVLTFTPRPKPVTGNVASEPLAGSALRASLEEAAQVALDAADKIIAVLDRMDGDPDHEDGGDAEPSLAAPENATGSQVTWLRGNDQDREAKTSEAVVPEVSWSPVPKLRLVSDLPEPPLAWGGNGNVLSATGVALFGLMTGEA